VEVFPGNSKERRFAHMLFAPKEKGQGLVEYALILVLVAIVVIAALMVLGPIIGNVFSSINSSLSGVG
jgi:pilus assembly protein Flp/PilA